MLAQFKNDIKYRKKVTDKPLPILQLRRGSRVILLQNLAVPLGLVNFAFGTVYDFFYEPNLGTIITQPTQDKMNNNNLQILIVLVQFDVQYYNSPSFLQDVPKIVSTCAIESDVLWGL
jgi:hypothetical protein